VLPALQFENIFEEPADASIEIDARAATGLRAITVLVNDKPLEKIKGNQLQRVRLSADLEPGRRFVVHLRAELPMQKPLGTVFPVNLRFFLNDQLVSGFRHVIRVATLTKAALQTLGVVYGMLRDVTTAWDLGTARELASEVKALVWAQRGTEPRRDEPGDWQRVFANLTNPLMGVSQSLVAVEDREPEYRAVNERLDELVNHYTLREAESAYLLVERVCELAYRVQEPAGRAVRRRQWQ
jgi:hypothetical protein